MGDRTYSNAEIEERMWEAVEKGRHIGMLGICGDAHHFQPMTGYVDREAGEIWFFTYKDTDLAQAAAAGGGHATFILQSRELWACIDGALSVARDPTRMDKYWSAHVAAWYPQGKDDPRLTMLRLDCTEAGVWIAEGGPVKYAFELAKAKATRTTPDVGERRDLNLH